MINLKGYRQVSVSGIPLYYKCKSHDTTSVYHKHSNTYWTVSASNSGEIFKMSIPSVVIPAIQESNIFIELNKKLKNERK